MVQLSIRSRSSKRSRGSLSKQSSASSHRSISPTRSNHKKGRSTSRSRKSDIDNDSLGSDFARHIEEEIALLEIEKLVKSAKEEIEIEMQGKPAKEEYAKERVTSVEGEVARQIAKTSLKGVEVIEGGLLGMIFMLLPGFSTELAEHLCALRHEFTALLFPDDDLFSRWTGSRCSDSFTDSCFTDSFCTCGFDDSVDDLQVGEHKGIAQTKKKGLKLDIPRMKSRR